MPELLIIGGSDAGISAALRAREVNPDWTVTVVVADAYPNFSICGLPYFLGGEVADWHTLAHRTAAEIEQQGIRLLLNQTATTVDPQQKTVTVQDRAEQQQVLSYDRLMIGTGATPQRPAIDGLEQEGVYLLHSMDDSFAVADHLATRQPQSAIIIGAGYIGLEMAEALTTRGLAVTLLQRGPAVHPSVDAEVARRVQGELERHGVSVATGVEVRAILRDGEEVIVEEAPGQQWKGDLVLVATGVRPVTALAVSAGINLGAHDAIQVTRTMQTNVSDIFAAGDCVETHHRLLPTPTYAPLGTTAHKQGRVAGENAVGGHRLFAGSVGTQVVTVFDQVIARTGLLAAEAQAVGFDPVSVDLVTWDHKVYYPGAHDLFLRLTADRSSQRVLGMQIVGHRGSEVAKRVDIVAAALYQDLRVDQLSDLDLSYVPPLSSPWDPVQMVAQAWQRAI